MLDFKHPTIQELIDQQGWRQLTQYDAIGAIYNFVRDDIPFGYNAHDHLPASRVLKDGYGQCNTKGTLLMALLRAVGIPTRFHGSTIYNELQRGAIPNYIFALVPDRIIHTWVEVNLDGRWINLEGYIIDKPKPQIEWTGEDTYIQSEGIADDFGIYSNPDDFHQEQGNNISAVKKFLFRYLLRHLMNRNVSKIRANGFISVN